MPLTPVGPRSEWPVRLTLAAPDLLVTAAAGFTVGPMLLLLANHFSLGLACLLGAVGAVIALVVHGLPAETAPPRELIYVAAAVVFVVGWVIVNAHYAGEDVYAIRDPSTYATAGSWLADHQSLLIQTHPEIFGMPSTSRGVTSGGFSNIAHKPVVYAQGNHLLPVSLALATKVGGAGAVFTANIWFGGAALFALFGLARRVTKSGGLALFATVAVGLTIPMIYVSRDTFSEPLTMMFLIGGLSLLVRGMTLRSPRLCALAGFVGACSAMVRVDSCVALLGYVAGATLFVAFVPRPDRRRAVWCAVAMVLGGVGPAFLGWLDVAWLSRQYYWSLNASIVHINLLLIVTTVVLAPLVVWVLWRPAVRRLVADPRTARRAYLGAATVMVLATVFLASRPLWWHVRRARDDVNIKSMQEGSGLPIDGHRTYVEQTVNWFGMYFGWTTAILGVVGYCLLLHALLRRRRLELAGPLCAGLALSAFYLYDPQIYPDQPWAMRRFVPIVIPIFFIAVVMALRWLGRVARGRVRLPARESRQPWVRRVAWAATVVGAVFVLFVPLAVLPPVWSLRQEGGQRAQLDALCNALPDNAAVVETDYASQVSYGQPLRTYCHVPTFGYPDVTATQLAPMYAAARASGHVLFALSQDPAAMPYSPASGPVPFSAVETTRWTTHLNKVPGGVRRDCITVYLSSVNAQGQVSSIIGGPVSQGGVCGNGATT